MKKDFHIFLSRAHWSKKTTSTSAKPMAENATTLKHPHLQVPYLYRKEIYFKFTAVKVLSILKTSGENNRLKIFNCSFSPRPLFVFQSSSLARNLFYKHELTIAGTIYKRNISPTRVTALISLLVTLQFRNVTMRHQIWSPSLFNWKFSN